MPALPDSAKFKTWTRVFNMEYGDLVSVQHNWWKSFAIFPCRTISKEWIWLETVYKRVVWRYTGFTDEPFTEYGTLFDIIKGDS